MVGAVFLGAVTDAMLLGHWYLVQPGCDATRSGSSCSRSACSGRSRCSSGSAHRHGLGAVDGTIDDGYGGLIGWMWVVACLTTIGLVVATWQALKEPSYSAVMAATGLLYLAILTGFGMDLLPHALLS